MGSDADLPLGLGDAEVIGVEGKVAGELGHLEVGDGSVQVHRSGGVLDVYIAEDVAALGDLALDFGESEVIDVAVDGEVSVDLVGGEIVAAVGEVDLDGAGDGAEMDVAVGGAEVDA